MGTYYGLDFKLTSFFDKGVFDTDKLKIDFKDGNSYKGGWPHNMRLLEGEFLYRKQDEETEIVKIKLDSGKITNMEEGQVLRYFDDSLKIK